MAQFSGAPLVRLYAQLQTALGTIINSSGTWTNTTAKLVPHNRIQIKRLIELIEANYKTGNASMLAGVPGRCGGTVSGEVPLMPSGAAGTAPNCNPILANIFNGTATLVAVTSATYNFLDGTANPLSLFAFNESGSGNTSQIAAGVIIETYTINLGGSGTVNLGFDGKCFYVLESDNFANEDATGLCGLSSSFPAEPSSPALVGNEIGAFTASVTFGGTATAEFVSAQISGTTGRTIRTDGVGRYATGVVQGRRAVALRSIKFADSDGAGLIAVKNAIASKAAMDVVIVQGATAGYIMTHTLKSVQFADATFSENGSGVDVDLGDAKAHASALANVNEYKLALT